MAETMLVAFGRFLRLLRERRGLSLDHVEALTAAYPEPVSKVYLSRVENGHSKIAFSRMIALCRAYEYPIDAASERLWLDLGVDRMEDPPETAGKGARELLREGRTFLQRGFRWHAYACARDAIAVAKTTPVSEVFRDHEEQFAVCLMNTGSAALELGRSRFSTEEYRQIRALNALTEAHSPLLMDRLAAALAARGEFSEATKLSDDALRAASTSPPNQFVGYLHGTRGFIASRSGDLATAEQYYSSAARIFSNSQARDQLANMLANLAQIYVYQERSRAATRALDSANRIAKEMGLLNLRARIGILSGEILSAASDHTAAERTWRDALRIAESIQDDILIFKLKFYLFLNAKSAARAAMANRYRKSLDRLAPWIPEGVEELRRFREMELGSDGLTFRSELPPRNGGPASHETGITSGD